MKKPQYIYIHHSAVSYTKNPDQWKATDNYHREKGWGGGGYNYEVAKNGSIHQFRPDGSVTAAQNQGNMNNGQALSICLDMNGDVEFPTEAQKEAVSGWLKEKMAKYSIKPENVFCHRKLAHYKSCPGSKMPDNILSYFISMETPQTEPSDFAKDIWKEAVDNGVVSQGKSSPHELLTLEKALVVIERMINLKK